MAEVQPPPKAGPPSDPPIWEPYLVMLAVAGVLALALAGYCWIYRDEIRAILLQSSG